MKILNEILWTEYEKNMIYSIVNKFGEGQHPVCDDQSFGYFNVSYLNEIFNSDNFNISIKNDLTPNGVEIVNSIKNKLSIL